MPELVTDSEDIKWNENIYNSDSDKSSTEEEEQVVNIDNIYKDNNIRFEREPGFRIRVKRQQTTPVNLDNKEYVRAIYENEESKRKIIIIQTGEDKDEPCILYSNAICQIEDGECILYGYTDRNSDNSEDLEDVYYSKTKVVKSKTDQWYIHVPIKQEDGRTVKTWIFADSGANTPCVKTKWALETFPNMISLNKVRKVMATPGGKIKPKYSLWMSFPAKNNTTLKVKMNLVNELPVDILADINMLEAFGYSFKCETPPIFRHREIEDIDLDLKEDDEFIKNRSESNWFKYKTKKKLEQANSIQLQGDDSDKISIIDTVYDDKNRVIFDDRVNEMKEKLRIVEKRVLRDDRVEIELIRKDNSQKERIDTTECNVTAIVNGLNDDKKLKSKNNIYKRCMMLMPKESYMAQKDEIERAKALRVNEELSFPNWDYLKAYERKYGNKFKNSYQKVMEWKNKWKGIFATHTYSRKTMYTEPARLGIKPEHRDKIMYCPQYPIGAEKRIHMINYTLINEDNGFWYKIPRSQHGIPYLMVAKRNSKGVIIRYRPAFDARVVNQYCQLMQCNMPTFQDFRNLHQRKGLTTVADIKNFFDCIPLWWKDQKYAVCFTPMGIYCMLCMTYGFMNAAPEAQRRTNHLAMFVTNSLAYIDDIQIKHFMDEGIDGIIESLERLAEYCVEKNIQLNPKKFYPAIDQFDAFGISNNMIGEMMSESYKKKILAFAQPKTKKQMRTYTSTLNYMNNHIYKNKKLTYWLDKLIEEVDPETKHKRLVWTKEAELAWAQLQYLINNLPLLHHPTREGQFCLKVDACNYGVGAELYQDQSEEGQKADWKLIDMWSKIMPTQLRHCHSMIHEAYGLVSAIAHWQFYLIRSRFIVSTDNMAVANIFGHDWKYLSPISQKQLIRLRSKLNSFDFETYHVKGIKNEIADGLSRFTMELIRTEKDKSTTKYPLELSAIESDDTMTPLLTPQQRKDLQLIMKESEYLTDKYNKLSKSKIPRNATIMSIIDDSCHCDPINLKLDLTDNINIKNVENNINYLYKENIDKEFNDTLSEYIRNSDYLERDRLKEYIETEKKNILRKGDEQMSENELKAMQEGINHIMNILDEMLDVNCRKLEELMTSEYWQHLTENKILNMINLLDEEYDPKEDEEYLKERSKRKPKRTIITRSMKKRKEEKDKSMIEDDDTIEQEREFSRFNLRFANARIQQETQENMMLKLFGKRSRINVLDFKKYRNYQESDNILALVIKLLKQPNKKKWKEKDLDLIYKDDKWLYWKLDAGSLLIENNILKCWDADPITRKRVKKIIVPGFLRGRLMEYAHHNVLQHHMSHIYTYRKLARRFWWNGLFTDVKDFCKRCVSCQFVKGGPRKRAPMRERSRPLPRQHIFADILGPVYQRFYVLVLVDYATGYSMLIPMEGCDSMSIAQAIIDYWIRIFGCFKYLETDWGSGFTSKLFESMKELLGYEHQIAEPRNHRSIGKVERVIGFLQSVINHYNLLLENELTEFEDVEIAWTKIKILLPFIQFGFNQRVTRITGISPNMAMFGTNLNDLSDIGRMNAKIDEFSNDDSIEKQDYILLKQLRDNIKDMNEIANSNWQQVTKLSVKSYNNRNKITPESVARNNESYKIGNRVLYFIGDKKVARYKWREKWSGPWILEDKLNDSTVIITDPTTGNQKRVSLDRIKNYNARDYIDYNDEIEHSNEYLNYQNELLDKLTNYNVRTAGNNWELDYMKFNMR